MDMITAYVVQDEEFREIMGTSQLKKFAIEQILNCYESIEEACNDTNLTLFEEDVKSELIEVMTKIFKDRDNAQITTLEAIGLLHFRAFEVDILNLC